MYDFILPIWYSFFGTFWKTTLYELLKPMRNLLRACSDVRGSEPPKMNSSSPPTCDQALHFWIGWSDTEFGCIFAWVFAGRKAIFELFTFGTKICTCIALQVVVTQMNGKDYSSNSVHVFHIGKLRIKLRKGWSTKARESYSTTMKVKSDHSICVTKVLSRA